jgi:hypothetical protein
MAARTALFAFFVLTVFALSGCDALNEFLGFDSATEEPGNKPGSGQEHPPQPVPAVPATVTVSGGAATTIQLTDEEKETWGDNYVYEVHTFVVSGYLTFSGDPVLDSVVADYLIVAGGGGAGNSDTTDNGGGGGAGGVLYKTAETLTLTDGAIQITVGAGGVSGGVNANSGIDSFIGDIVVPGGGGGTNGVGGNETYGTGKNGGSGGGGATRGGDSYDTGGYGKRRTGTTGLGTDDPPVDDAVMGNDGSNGANRNGGGGGGAGTSGYAGGAGGDPWTPGEDAAWIQTATGTPEFSRGGNGSIHFDGDIALPGGPGEGYGYGGTGGFGQNITGGAGHGGVVVIRFLRVPTASPE